MSFSLTKPFTFSHSLSVCPYKKCHLLPKPKNAIPLSPPSSSVVSRTAPSSPMKDRRGAAGGFPFSIGCMSQSAVSVADPLDKKQQQPQTDPSSTATPKAGAEERSVGVGVGSGEEKPGIVAAGVQRLRRLIKGIRSLTQMFAAYDGQEEEEEEREIVIGYPTDVQHVGHIGWDGGLNKVGGMAMVSAFSLPSSLSLRQLEIAMEASSHA